MERLKNILKNVLKFILIYALVLILRLIIDDEIIRPLFQSWLDDGSLNGPPKLCYIEPITYIVLYLISFLLYKMVIKSNVIYIMCIVAIVIQYLTNLYGIIGCTCIGYVGY